MLVNEGNIRDFNALLDHTFEKGIEGARLLREIGRDDLASNFERSFTALHDDAMAQHGRLITAAKANDVPDFRAQGRKLTEVMMTLKKCMMDSAAALTDFRQRRR